MESWLHTISTNRNAKIGSCDPIRINQDFIKAIGAQIGSCAGACRLLRHFERYFCMELNGIDVGAEIIGYSIAQSIA